MGCEYSAPGYLKPTGPWLTASQADYYADHPLLRPTGTSQQPGTRDDRTRLQTARTPGAQQFANIWEFTDSINTRYGNSSIRRCRLCGLDYVTVGINHQAYSDIPADNFATSWRWVLGTARLELAIDENFTEGYFVEIETVKCESRYTTLLPHAIQENSEYQANWARQVWFLMGGTAAQADIADHASQPLPSWLTQNYNQDFRGMPRTVSASGGERLTIPVVYGHDSEYYNGSLPFVHIKSFLRFGTLDGTVLAEREDVGPEIALRHDRFWYLQNAGTHLAIGVHNNRVIASVADSFFSHTAHGDDWLWKRRRSRVVLATASDNSFPTTLFGDVVTASVTAPVVREVRCHKVTESAATASPKLPVDAAAATSDKGPSGPAALVWVPSHLFPDGAAQALTANKAGSFRASRINSVAPMLQVSGAPSQLSHNCVASTRQLSISTRTIVDTATPLFASYPSGTNEDGVPYELLPGMYVTQVVQRQVDGEQKGNALQWTEATRSPAPTVSSRGDAVAYRAWRDDPFGGAPQDIATPGVQFSLGSSDRYGYVTAQQPRHPWNRHPIAEHSITLSQNAGQSVYVGNGDPGLPVRGIPTLDLVSRRNEFVGVSANYASTLGGQLDISTGFVSGSTAAPGAFMPRTFTGRAHWGVSFSTPSLSTGTRTTSVSTAEWRDTYSYDLWPQAGGVSYPVSGTTRSERWPVTQFPTLPAWQTLAAGRYFSAIQSCQWTPLQLDCVAWFTRGYGASGESYSPQQAVDDETIPYDEALRAARRPFGGFDPLGGTVVFNWRRTWKFDAVIRSGVAQATGSTSSRTEGRLRDLSDGVKYPSSFSFTFADEDQVNSLQETVELFWSLANAEEQTVTFYFEDLWSTYVDLNAAQWAALEGGQSVSVHLLEQNNTLSRFASVDSPTFRTYDTGPFPFGSNSAGGRNGVWRNFAVPARLEMTLQFQ